MRRECLPKPDPESRDYFRTFIGQATRLHTRTPTVDRASANLQRTNVSGKRKLSTYLAETLTSASSRAGQRQPICADACRPSRPLRSSSAGARGLTPGSLAENSRAGSLASTIVIEPKIGVFQHNLSNIATRLLRRWRGPADPGDVGRLRRRQ